MIEKFFIYQISKWLNRPPKLKLNNSFYTNVEYFYGNTEDDINLLNIVRTLSQYKLNENLKLSEKVNKTGSLTVYFRICTDGMLHNESVGSSIKFFSIGGQLYHINDNNISISRAFKLQQLLGK